VHGFTAARIEGIPSFSQQAHQTCAGDYDADPSVSAADARQRR
jgi:hypothetical protein